MKIISLYREAVSKIPILRYSWVLIATICILAVSGYLKLKNSDVLLYSIAILIISLLAFLLSFFVRSEDLLVKIASHILVYCILVTIGTIILSFAYFILSGKPEFYKQWFSDKNHIQKDSIKRTKDTLVVVQPSIDNKPHFDSVRKRNSKKFNELICAGRVIDAETGNYLSDVKVKVKRNFKWTDSYGNFNITLMSTNNTERVTMTFEKDGYKEIIQNVEIPNLKIVVQLLKL